ncbi:hypothetical protein [Streptomyces sp. NPDC047130]|uniref:hypothetical protein n=1 Tax=Streptomyces sp. NPDC047130 TaxID=3155261 RepID=UPI00340643CA
MKSKWYEIRLARKALRVPVKAAGSPAPAEIMRSRYSVMQAPVTTDTGLPRSPSMSRAASSSACQASSSSKCC